MYALVVVEVNIARELLSLARKWYASMPIVSDTFLLQSTVKPFYVSVIVRPAEAAVASNNAILSKCLLEVTTKLKSIVSLHHLEMEAKKTFGHPRWFSRPLGVLFA